MWSFAAFCDEFYVNTRLYLKLDLDPSRESLLHFFEQVRRAYPRLARMRQRDDGALILDEDAQDDDGRRFLRVDPGALKFGYFNPPSAQSVSDFAEKVLKQAPYQLTLSDLDYDYLEVIFGFDLEYRGNHDELVAETLFQDHPIVSALSGDGMRLIDCQPFFGVSLSDDCEKQVYVEVKGRTSTFELRTGEFEPTPLSVYLTVRRYWNAGGGGTGTRDLYEAHSELMAIGQHFASERVVPAVVRPLANAIASRR